MEKFIHTGQAYKEYDKHVIKTEHWLEGEIPSLANVDSQILHKRLGQKIVALTANSYIVLCSKRAQDNLPLNPTEKILILNGISLNTVNGEVKLMTNVIVRGIVEFFYEWIAVFLANIVSLVINTRQINSKSTLVFGIPKESLESGGNGDKFEAYCDQGQIGVLKTCSLKIVQSLSDVVISNEKFWYVKRPVVKFVRQADLSFVDRIQLLIKQLFEPIIFLYRVAKCPLLSILGRDFGLFGTIKFLSAKNLIESVIITNSNHNDQYLWMRNSIEWGFRVHKIHYSQNSRPMVYKVDQLSVDHPILRHICVDEHWVWTPGYKTYLQSHGHLGEVHVVGPIMFYNIEKSSKRSGDKIKVMIFDVTPVYEHVSKSIGIINNYYNSKNMMDFLSIIVKVTRELEIESGFKYELCLKHKRYFNKNHDVDYINYCNQLAKEQQITLVDYDSNIFTLISESTMVISIPYTSTAYVASSLGVPSLYFDSSSELYHSFEKADGVYMIDDKTLLKNWIKAYS